MRERVVKRRRKPSDESGAPVPCGCGGTSESCAMCLGSGFTTRRGAQPKRHRTWTLDAQSRPVARPPATPVIGSDSKRVASGPKELPICGVCGAAMLIPSRHRCERSTSKRVTEELVEASEPARAPVRTARSLLASACVECLWCHEFMPSSEFERHRELRHGFTPGVYVGRRRR